MKKGLLIAIGVGTGLSLSAQRPANVGGVKKWDLTGINSAKIDAESVNFFAQASATARNGNPTVQANGTKFTSSRNAFTLLVSQSNCMTANQALGAAMFTARISADWSPPSVNSGFIEHTWTTNNGSSWDSTYFANNGTNLYRYPSGAIFNPASNTTLSNAFAVGVGPYTDGSGWMGNYYSSQNMVNAQTNVNTVDNGTSYIGFARIDVQSTDQHVWVTAGLYTDPNGTTALAQGFRGAAIMKGTLSSNAFVWQTDSIKPTFHQDGTGANDCYTITHLAFSQDGNTGYAVFFGVDASATTSQTRTFSPLVWKTTDAGATWTRYQQNFDFTTISTISNNLIQASDGNLKPWFSQNNGSDVTVDNNGQLHIFCEVGSGASNDNDSLGFTWTLTGANNTARHFMYDVHTTTNGWNAWLIDTLLSSPNDQTSQWSDGTSTFATDARAQISRSSDGTKLFYIYSDTDPNIGAGDNNFPNLFGRAVDLSIANVNANATARQQFSTDDNLFWQYVSNITLVNGTTYTVPVSNSLARDLSFNMLTPFDHYYMNNVQFTAAQFNTTADLSAVGIEEFASVGTLNFFPNPANDQINVVLDLINSENVSIEIVNSLGQTVLVENRDLAAGNSVVRMNTENLTEGVYFLTVTAGNARAVEKVVIQ
ncbi:MAG: T9SS type A sorting domain-containing protein [Bacteroidetes bacterium]|nr:T9SS type A sorting domain-containing protein [Bacteroidota bacterium]